MTGGNPSNLKELCHLVVAAVVTEGEIEWGLAAQLEGLKRARFLSKLALAADRSEVLDPLVREVVRKACAADPPILTRKKLLRILSCRSPATLWSHWRSVPGCFGTPSTFLQRIALLHFIHLRQSGLTTAEALARLQMSRARLHEAVRREFDTTPAALIVDPSRASSWVEQAVSVILDSAEGEGSRRTDSYGGRTHSVCDPVKEKPPY